MVRVERSDEARNIELEYRVCGVSGYKCCHCEHHLGSIADEEDKSDSGFEDWEFCPYCGTPLH